MIGGPLLVYNDKRYKVWSWGTGYAYLVVRKEDGYSLSVQGEDAEEINRNLNDGDGSLSITLDVLGEMFQPPKED